jgi:hypothetical protein
MNESVTFYEIYYADADDLPCWQFKAAFPSSVEADKWLKTSGDQYDFYQLIKVTKQPVSTYDRRNTQ